MNNKYSRSEYEIDINLDINDILFMNFALEDLADGLSVGVISNNLAGVTGNNGYESECHHSRDWLAENYTAISGAIKLAGCVGKVTAKYLEALETRRVNAAIKEMEKNSTLAAYSSRIDPEDE